MEVARARHGMTIVADRNEGRASRFRDGLVAGSVDAVQPDVMISGGYTQVPKIAGMAGADNGPISNGAAAAGRGNE